MEENTRGADIKGADIKGAKKLLLITPFFAPQSHAAMFRVHKLAKGLPDLGWEVHILTVDKNYNYNEDQELLAELPPSVKIHRSRYIEPTLRGVRMALGGRDRSFEHERRRSTAGSANTLDDLTQQEGRPKSSSLRSLKELLIKDYLWTPDAYWTWKNSALTLANKIIKQEQIPIVYTTSLPYSTLSIGHALKRRHKLAWVADFRDPLLYSFRFGAKNRWNLSKQKKLLDLAVQSADHLVYLSSSYPLILADQYEEVDWSRISYIPTGADESLFPPPKPRKSGQIIFVGEFLKSYGQDFFETINKVFHDPEVQAAVQPKLIFLGRKEVNAPLLKPFIEQYQLEAFIEILDHQPQSEVYSLIAESQAGVLCTSKYYPWWNQFAKLVDYLALQIPVLSWLPNPSEGRKWLEAANLGLFFDGELEQDAQRLKDFLLGRLQREANQNICKQFLMHSQVQQFNHLFEALL